MTKSDLPVILKKSITKRPMPLTLTLTLYKFEELSDDAKQKAVDSMRNINVDHDWWDYIYEDADNVGLEITEFDIYRGTIKGKLNEDLLVSCKTVRTDHGKDCDTFKTAKQYLAEYCDGFIKWLSENEVDIEESRLDSFEDYTWSSEAQVIANEYEKALLEDYLSILRKDYEYFTSDDMVIETIEANEYLFDEYGNHKS